MQQLVFVLVVCCFLTSGNSYDYQKEVIVSEVGSDNMTCLSGQIDCKTLGYALNGMNNSTSITVTYSHSFGSLSSSSAMYITNKYNIAIIGKGEIDISCEQGEGISFVSVSNILVQGIYWKECSVSHPTSGYFPELNISFSNASSAMFLHHCLNVTISRCRFSSKYGSGVSMYDVGGNVVIENSTFASNSYNCTRLDNEGCSPIGSGLTIEFTFCSEFKVCPQAAAISPYNSHGTYTIQDCNFANNDNLLEAKAPDPRLLYGNMYWPYGKGGGMAIVFRGRSKNNTFTISGNCCFQFNKAVLGGSLFVEALDQATNNSIIVERAQDRVYFSNNVGNIGGAVYFKVFLFPHNDASAPGDNYICITGATFSENHAINWGGAFVLEMNGQYSSQGTGPVSFIDCLWVQNVAPNSAALSLSLAYSSVFGNVASILFDSNTWTNNTGLCAIKSNQIHVSFSGSTFIQANPSLGLCAFYTVIHMEGDVLFQDNMGSFGAAVYLAGSAWISLAEHVTVTFANNNGNYGGAIYYDDFLLDTNAMKNDLNVRHCIFEYEYPTFPIDEWNVTVEFIDNNARVGIGNSVYLKTIFNCIQNNNVVLLNNDVFAYYPNMTGQLATPVYALLLHNPVYIYNSSYYIDLMLGQNIVFNITALDHFNNSADATISIDLQCDAGPVQYGLSGLPAIIAHDSLFSSDLYVYGAEESTSNCCLILRGADHGLSHLEQSIWVNFTPPRLGFVYDPVQRSYRCHDSQYLTCNSTSLKVCIDYGYWYGKITRGNTSMYTTASCQFCQYSNNKCPTAPCNEFHTLCELPKLQDDQCAGNRGGPLCTRCKPGYSFTYDALQCVPTDTCSAGHFVLFSFINITLWIVAVVGLILILRLKLHVGSGYMYSFLYYFSVVQLFLPATLSSLFLKAVVFIFTSLPQLDPKILGLFRICVLSELDHLAHTFLHYLHPIIISIIILLFVWIARYRPRFLHLAESSAIHAICLLVLLSFTSVTETSFILLSPIKFDDMFYVKIEPSIQYFDPEHHLPYAVVALLLEIFVIFPIIILLLASPLLMKYFNLTKIKPLLDEYQACYRNEYRWVAGLYFLSRQAVFLISAFHIGSYGDMYILQVFSIALVVLHTALQPYKSKYLNILDTIMLLDLALVLLLYGHAADSVFQDVQVLREILIHILVLFPCLYFLTLCGALLYMRMRPCLKYCLHKTNRVDPSTEEPAAAKHNSLKATPTVSYLPPFDQDRESLLALLQDNEKGQGYEATNLKYNS